MTRKGKYRAVPERFEMSFSLRLAVIAFWPLLAVAAILHGRGVAAQLPEASAGAVTGAIHWLALCSGLYVLNHGIGWRYPDSWPLFMTRALGWALIAYLGICNLVDLAGNNPDTIANVIGLTPQSSLHSAAVVVQERVWALVLVMSLFCIGFGLESTGEESRNPSD